MNRLDGANVLYPKPRFLYLEYYVIPSRQHTANQTTSTLETKAASPLVRIRPLPPWSLSVETPTREQPFRCLIPLFYFTNRILLNQLPVAVPASLATTNNLQWEETVKNSPGIPRRLFHRSFGNVFFVSVQNDENRRWRMVRSPIAAWNMEAI